ncbi:MAG: DUF3108 domain-containing protein [Candidatus Omnitrophica bacterium]|nr:DUF3108 domain-containing protein [Candidatus Omnitrophota bacterium]
MMKKLKIIFFILIGLIIFLIGWENYYNNKIETIIRKVIASPERLEILKDSFSLNFQINYLNVFPIGKAFYHSIGLSQYNQRSIYQLEMTAEDTFPFSWLKPAKAKIISYLDTSKMLPVYFSTEIHMDDKIKEKNEIIYNQEEGYIISEGKRYVIFPFTHEPLSLIFYLMRIKFDAYKGEELNLNSNQANYRVKIEVLNKKEYRIEGRAYKVWEVNLLLRRRKGDIMRHSLDAKIYFLDTGDKNIPLLGKAYNNSGNIFFRLAKFDNLS